MTVTQKEIVEALWVGQQYAEEVHNNPNNSFNRLIERIEAEGIKPPEGYAIVPIEPITGIAIDEGFIPAKFRTKESP